MSKLTTEYIMSSTSFENSRVNQVFRWDDETPVIYRMIGGVIIGKAPAKVYAHQLKADRDRCLMAVNTLVMLTYLDVQDSMVTISKFGKGVFYSITDYQVPTNNGLNILCNSSDAIYTDVYSKLKDKRGFKRQITDFEPSKHILKFEDIKNFANDKPLYDVTKDVWNGVLNPQELVNFFEMYKVNDSSTSWNFESVSKETRLLSDFGCFYTGENSDKLVTMSDSVGNVNDTKATALGVTSIINVEGMFTETVSPSAEEVYNFISKGATKPEDTPANPE